MPGQFQGLKKGPICYLFQGQKMIIQVNVFQCSHPLLKMMGHKRNEPYSTP